MILRNRVRVVLGGIMFLGAAGVSGQTYPNKPIRIVTGSSGSASDFASRLIAHGLTSTLREQVVVDNRGGIPGEIVSKAPPDGYTFLIYGTTFWLGPLLQDISSYDVITDFTPITMASSSPNVLVVYPSLPVKSVNELIALAKGNPGKLNYASGIAGSSNHLAAELFKVMTGVNIVNIPYKGAGPALNDLIGGHVQLMFATAPSASSLIKTGRLRAVAVTSAQPSALFPGLPTVAATVPGYESVSSIGIFAPAKMPAPLVKRLNVEIVRVLNQIDVKEKFVNSGSETVGSSPQELAYKVKFEIGRMGKLIKAAGIRGY